MKEGNKMKIKQILAIPFGMLLLVIAILARKFFPENDALNFIEGMLIVMSILLNISYIIAIYQKSKEK